MTKRSYTAAVLKGIDKALREQSAAAPAAKDAIEVRLLLSIDRREDSEAALDTARLAVELQGRGVVGIDLSGEGILSDTVHLAVPPAVGQSRPHHSNLGTLRLF
jgi:adenosine deaminase